MLGWRLPFLPGVPDQALQEKLGAEDLGGLDTHDRLRFWPTFVREILREVLESAWYLAHPDLARPADTGMTPDDHRAVHTAIREMIHRACVERATAFRAPAVHQEYLAKQDYEWAMHLEDLSCTVWMTSGPVWTLPLADGAAAYVSDELPAIAYAEILNLLEHRPESFDALGWCVCG
jgi:hypothetical protein